MEQGNKKNDQKNQSKIEGDLHALTIKAAEDELLDFLLPSRKSELSLKQHAHLVNTYLAERLEKEEKAFKDSKKKGSIQFQIRSMPMIMHLKIKLLAGHRECTMEKFILDLLGEGLKRIEKSAAIVGEGMHS